MTYRELLELYKKNELEEKKKTEVEADIEKQEAISDYLYEKSEIPELDTSFNPNNFSINEENRDSIQEQDFLKMIKRSIRRAFLKMGTVICLVVLIIVLFVQLALPKIMSSFYYNPGKEVAKNTNQISLDMAVYTELTMPTHIRNNVSVENNGYGNYDILIYQNFSRNGIFTNVSGKIERGKLTLYDVNVLKRPTVNAFAWYQMYGDRTDSLRNLYSEGHINYSSAGNASDATKYLNKLDDNTDYLAYVTLDKMMNYEDFKHFLSNWESLYDVWCALCTNDDDLTEDTTFKADNLGFQCSMSSSTLMDWDNKTYPNLLLWDNDGNIEKLEKDMMDEDYMATHFTSMLRYMSSQDKFLTMMKENPIVFSNAAEYVEKNGLTVYGFATVADKENLLNLSKVDEVYEIYTQPYK